MKRYNIYSQSVFSGEIKPEEEEDKDGEWVKYSDHETENKKLRAYLERIIVDYNQHLDYDNFPECTIYWFASRAQYLAKEALKQ